MTLSKKLGILFTALAVATTSMPAANAAGIAGLARHNYESFKRIREGRNTMAPFAFINFCVKSPADCQPGKAQTVDWTPRTHALVAQTNRRINRAIRPVNDSVENWSANATSGDCEDFALAKRRALLQAGLPASALRMAVATTATGEGHAVLIVKTKSGDFVLDNRNNRMLMWHQTDLNWIKIASAENPWLWRRVL